MEEILQGYFETITGHRINSKVHISLETKHIYKACVYRKNRVYLSCVKKHCRGRVSCGLNSFSHLNDHNHDSSDQDVNNLRFLERCKERAAYTTENIRDIYKEEQAKITDPSPNISFDTLYNTLYKVRKCFAANASSNLKMEGNFITLPVISKDVKKVPVPKRPHPTETVESYDPPPWMFDELNFLANQNNHAAVAKEENFIYEEVKDDEIDDSINASTSEPEQVPKRKKRQLNSRVEELVSAACNYFIRSESDEDLISKGWALQLRNMASEQRIYAEKFINEILLEGKLGTLHRKSLTLNENGNYHPQFKIAIEGAASNSQCRMNKNTQNSEYNLSKNGSTNLQYEMNKNLPNSQYEMNKNANNSHYDMNETAPNHFGMNETSSNSQHHNNIDGHI